MTSPSTTEDASLVADFTDHGIKIWYTIILYLTCFCYGLFDVTATTLLDVAELTHSTTALVAYGLSIKTIAYCVGSLLFAWVFTPNVRQLGMTACLLIIGIVHPSLYDGLPVLRGDVCHGTGDVGRGDRVHAMVDGHVAKGQK